MKKLLIVILGVLCVTSCGLKPYRPAKYYVKVLRGSHYDFYDATSVERSGDVYILETDFAKVTTPAWLTVIEEKK